jgi:hypothetical protein
MFAARCFQAGGTILEIDDSRVVDDLHPLNVGEDTRHCD